MTAADKPRWFTPGVASVGAASFLSDAGHEIATSVLPSFVSSSAAIWRPPCLILRAGGGGVSLLHAPRTGRLTEADAIGGGCPNRSCHWSITRATS